MANAPAEWRAQHAINADFEEERPAQVPVSDAEAAINVGAFDGNSQQFTQVLVF